MKLGTTTNGVWIHVHVGPQPRVRRVPVQCGGAILPPPGLLLIGGLLRMTGIPRTIAPLGIAPGSPIITQTIGKRDGAITLVDLVMVSTRTQAHRAVGHLLHGREAVADVSGDAADERHYTDVVADKRVARAMPTSLMAGAGCACTVSYPSSLGHTGIHVVHLLSGSPRSLLSPTCSDAPASLAP